MDVYNNNIVWRDKLIEISLERRVNLFNPALFNAIEEKVIERKREKEFYSSLV